MPINPQDMMARVAPLAPIKLDLGGGQGMSMERERMKLMREQFENTKKQQQEQMALAKLEESGRMAREQMQNQRMQDQAAAQAAAAKKEAQDKTLAKFSELNGSGDIEGARAMIPLMASMGMDISLEGEENGLPRYRIGPDPEAAARDAGAIGYPTDDTGVLTETPGVTSTEDAFKRAQEASATAEATGTPARGPDQPDYTGAVPKNVLDMGAISAQTQARLNPALSGLVNAYPEAYRGSAESTAGAIRGLGLPAVKSVEMFDKMRGGPDAMMRGEMAADAQRAQANERRGSLTAAQSGTAMDNAFSRADKGAVRSGIPELKDARTAGQQVIDALTDNDPNNDRMIGSLFTRMMGEKGTLAASDVARAIGDDSLSTVDRISAWFSARAEGGLSRQQRDAIVGMTRQAMEKGDKRIDDWLADMDETIEAPDTAPEVVAGYKEYRKTAVPRALRDAYDKRKKERSGGGSAPNTAGSSPDYGGEGVPTIPETSRIAFVHNNPGNLMFAGQEGAEKGEPKEGGGNWAKFSSVEAGLKAIHRQVEKDKGMTIRAFITKYAPPTDGNDTEKYIADAAREMKADPDDTIEEGVDAYDLVRFIAKQESGTELPYQYAKRDAEIADYERAHPETKGAAEAPVTGKAGADRMRELLKKGGY